MSYVLYTDNALLMGDWSFSNAINLVRILGCFHFASGLKCNSHKICLYGVRMDYLDMELGALVLRCQMGSFMFIHLAISIGVKINRVKNWKPIIDKFQAKLSGWKESALSFGGRLTLIMSMLGSLPTYYLSLFKIPIKYINDLERVRRRFLWGNSREDKGVYWVKWKDVLSPKSMSGVESVALGI